MITSKAIRVIDDNVEVLPLIRSTIDNYGQKEGFSLCDVSEIIKNHEIWNQMFPKMPIFYDVRCNNTKMVLEIQAALGVNFSCVSKEEISKILALEVSPDKILFANPAIKVSHLKYAAKNGIKLITFDNEEELHKIKDNYSSAKLVLRVEYEELPNKKNICKYGIKKEDEIKNIFRQAKCLNLNIIGVTISANLNYELKSYVYAVKLANKVKNIALHLNNKLEFINFDIYHNVKKNNIDKISKVLNHALNMHFPDKGANITALIGNFFIETAFKTIANIHSKAFLEDGTRMYYLDIGVYNGFYPAIFKHGFTCETLKEDSGKLHHSIVWGPTCDSTDKINLTVDSLPELEVGDWIVFQNTGAFTFPITFEFNGFTLPNILHVIRKKQWLLLIKNNFKPTAGIKFATGDSFEAPKSPYVFNKMYYNK